MVSLKKRLIIGITLLTLLVAVVVPVGAEDTSTSTSPSLNTVITSSYVTVQLNSGSTTIVTLSIPVRCGNNC
jgi:hypothetical protein